MPKNGRPFHMDCSACYQENHKNWINYCINCNKSDQKCKCENSTFELRLVDTAPCSGGLTKDVRKLIRTTTEDWSARPQFPSKAELINDPSLYKKWLCKALKSVERTAQLNSSIGCALFVFSIIDKDRIDLLMIGEKNSKASSTQYGPPGGRGEWVPKTGHRRSNPQELRKEDVTYRPEIVPLTIAREYYEEVGNYIVINDLYCQQTHVVAFDRESKDPIHSLESRKTEILIGLIIQNNQKTRDKLLERKNKKSIDNVQTVDITWADVRKLSKISNLRDCAKNGLKEMVEGVTRMWRSIRLD
jgi:hypothetical protein